MMARGRPLRPALLGPVVERALPVWTESSRRVDRHLLLCNRSPPCRATVRRGLRTEATLMCGIYGVAALGGRLSGHRDLLEAMGARLHHRGPDAHRVLEAPGACFGAERLRIVDLSPRADQPFADPEARLLAACNGEIYNHTVLRARYPQYRYRSHTDIETLLPLYLDAGVAGLDAIDGMFALALWDRRERTLVLARDRAGEKPLFYTRVGQEVWFASEIEALLEHPAVSRELDPLALQTFLALGYVVQPRTMFAAIRQVEAGTAMLFGPDGTETVRYWQPPRRDAREALAPAEATDRLRAALVAAVEKQMVADVPVGVFLSGGLDSSIIAHLVRAARAPAEPVLTFTMRFAEASYDEGSWARTVADRIGTRHIEAVAGPEDLREALEALTAGVAEPLADPALLPTWLLARKAREHVVVVLGGEGADELFGGYPSYLGHQLSPWFRALPRPLRRLIGATAGLVPASPGKVTIEYLVKRFLAGAEEPWHERHLRWFGSGLPGAPPPTPWGDADPAARRTADVLAEAMRLDFETYLCDNLLVKLDRATMLHSLEARAPFLDRAVVELAMTLPTAQRVHRFDGKWILKRAAAAWLPREIIHRRKRGFSVPIAAMLNGSLREEADRLLAPERLLGRGHLPPGVAATAQRLLAEHRAHHANHSRPLWMLFTLEAWLERWAEDASCAPAAPATLAHAQAARSG